jgi:hypothetical protein
MKTKPTEKLMREYIELGKDIFGFYARNAADERDKIARELNARGFTHIPHMFGPMEIQCDNVGFVGRQSIAKAMSARA